MDKGGGVFNLSTQKMSYQKCQEYDTPIGMEWLQAKCHTLKNFECIVFSQVPKAKRMKLNDHGEKCIFIGYSEESKVYKLYNSRIKKLVVSGDVIFNEEWA